MSSIKRELIDHINRLDVEKQERVLEFVRSLEKSSTLKTYSPRELMRLPLEERNKIVAAALECSLHDDAELFDV